MNCSVHPGRPAYTSCARCKSPICMDCEVRMGAETICRSCLAKARDASPAEPGPPAVGTDQIAVQAATSESPGYIGAIGAGLLVAIVCAVIWDKVVFYTQYKAGFVSIILGMLVGGGVVLGANKRYGPALPIVGAVLAAVGILLGELLLIGDIAGKMVEELKGAEAGHISIFDKLFVAIKVFPLYIREDMGFLDWVFVAIGVYSGYKVPARMMQSEGEG